MFTGFSTKTRGENEYFEASTVLTQIRTKNKPALEINILNFRFYMDLSTKHCLS